jgi:signal transduction histidine kinase
VSDEGSDRALDALPDGVVIADADGMVTIVNRAAGVFLGVPPAEARGRPLADVLALQDQDGNDWSSTNRPYQGLATRTAVPEQSWLLPDGNEVLVVARIRRPALDRPVDQVAVSLRSGRGRARLDRERSDLVATVAHELRSPLTGVKGFVQALLNRWDKLNDDQKKLMLATVHADSERLSRLIAELLDVARIDTGRLQLYPRHSDAGVLVGRVVDSVRASTSRRIELDVADGLPEICVDPDKFTQAMTNLVENAVRHGDGTVRVRATPLALSPEDEHEDVRITVDDEGEGIAPEMRARVFTKFWKEGASGGSGLGMYIVNGLVRAHGGTVAIDSAPGGGARVIVTWPHDDRRQ